MKKEGKRQKKLPDPKAWKWCKHPECRKVVQQLKDVNRKIDQEANEYSTLCGLRFTGTRIQNEQDIMKYSPGIQKFCALFLEEYCWKHLSNKAKAAYKGKIEEWISKGNSLESANMFGVDIREIRTLGVNLKDVNLEEANLQSAWFSEANLEDAHLRQANLQGAYLGEANLKEAHLSGANLKKANLSAANLQGAMISDTNLQETIMIGTSFQKAWLGGSNLMKADISQSDLQRATLYKVILYEADLSDVNLDGCQDLTWKQIKRIREESDKRWSSAQDTYRLLKNYFHQAGKYEDESKAYYREKLMAKHLSHAQLFGKRWRVGFEIAKRSWCKFCVWFVRGTQRAFKNIGRFFKKNKHESVRRRWLGLWFMWALTGFGEKWIRTIAWAVGTFIFFGLLHWLGTNAGWWSLLTQTAQNTVIQTKHLLNCLYFSLVTFVTLGFGDIWPDAWVAKILVGAEVVLGYLFLGMIVVLIARKFGR